ncbi:FecR domain-containing protein [Sphingomonas cavernae]|uniref:Peptidoglycan-binding protein n=1 Tax=Sphingomonas cavernae TaxID=2320861 RepID=A0A418WJT1_9SPHN|nr:FecR domain-containing protein [Sphingomonas cavernae]RJF90260.1 peptidoglycan-binding protein [Sphingomonas cavernae]
MSVTLALLALLVPAHSASPARTDSAVRYRVKRGDNLFTLGERYFLRPGDYREVQRLNRVTNPRRLPTGKVLLIPRRLLRSEQVKGTVAAYRGNVRIVRGKSEARAVTGDQVTQGMMIATGAKSFVTIELPDNSRFSLPSNSWVGITRLRRTLLTGQVERSFSLLTGRSDWDVTPSRTNPFSVTTPIATTAVRGTSFRVSYNEATESMTVGTLQGTVAVRDQAIEAGSGAAVRSGSAIKPVRLIDAPELDRSGTIQQAETLAFSARTVDNASSYGFEIASDAGFIDRLASERTATPQVTFDSLPNGTYFIRTTALDAEGIEGQANVFSFDRQFNTIEADAPQAGTAGNRKDFLFRWRGSGAGKVEYRFVLSRDEAGLDRLVDRAGLLSTNLTVSDLPSGTWHWRVWSLRFEDGRYSETVTPPQRLQVGDAR